MYLIHIYEYSKLAQRAERYSRAGRTKMVVVEEIVESTELAQPSPKRRRPNPVLALTLTGQKLQFEVMPGEGTYCAFFTELDDGVAHEIRKAAQGLRSAGNVAFATHGSIEHGWINHGYLVLNWNGQSSNLYSTLKDRLRRLNVSMEGGAGKLVLIRPMKPYLQNRLENTVALVYPPDGLFWVHPHTEIKEEEKLEAMKDWAEDNRGDLLGTAEDYVPFAEAFEQLLGKYFKKDDTLQHACVRIFGQCFPDIRTPWYKHEKHVYTQKAQEPIHTYDQIPPEVRVKVKGRMQPKNKDLEGVILEGCCIECGDKTEAGAQYCIKTKCLEMKKLTECNECPNCGSGNLKKVRKMSSYFVLHGDIMQKREGESAAIQCNDCNHGIYVKPAKLPRGVWVRGAKRKRPEEPVPEWGGRKA